MHAQMTRRRRPAAPWVLGCLLTALVATSATAYEDQIRSESRYLAGQIAERGKTAAAVIDFTDLDGAVTHLGRFLAEEMSVALANDARSFRVVDRTHIRSLLKEHKLSSSGLIDPETARQLGRIAGVDALITGVVTPLGDSMRLSIKVLDSDSAQVIASSSFNVAKTQAIDSLLRKGVASSYSGGGSGGGGGTTVPSGAKVERQGIVFALQGCQRSNETVHCHLVLTNQAQDQQVSIRGNSTRVFDHFGNEIYSSRIALGSESGTRWVHRDLVRGVPIKASATFEGLAQEVRRLTLVEFDFYSFTIQFKDVPIS